MLSDQFIVTRLDTRNGKADFVPTLKVERNATYVLILAPDGTETARLKNPPTLDAIARLVEKVVPPQVLVTLKYPGVADLKNGAKDNLHLLAIELLTTSKVNSSNHLVPFPHGLAGVNANYRQTVSGSYLLVRFKLPRTFKTAGGEMPASEVVIGLGRADWVDSMFTIDSEGRVIEYGQYDRAKATSLLKTAKEAVEDQ